MYIQYTPVGSNQYWTPYLWWANSWIGLASFQIGTQAPSQTDNDNESITDGSHFVLPQTQVDGTNLYTCTPVCAWVTWTTAIPQSWQFTGGLPYHHHFQTYYSRWYAHSH